MNEADRNTDRAMQIQLDRLAAGELPEVERRALLAWLEEDAGRWRACAIAFLEVQSWERALTQWPTDTSAEQGWSLNGHPAPMRHEALASRSAELVSSGKPPTRASLATALSVLAVAASLAIAFAGGIFTARSWPVLAPGPMLTAEGAQQAQPEPPEREATQANADGPLLATMQVRTNLDPRVPMLLQVPVARAGEPQPPRPKMSDYVRSQWERRGFAVTEEVRYLPARLPDGREITVPINQVRFEYRGTPVL
jgi:hypothetical protein